MKFSLLVATLALSSAAASTHQERDEEFRSSNLHVVEGAEDAAHFGRQLQSLSVDANVDCYGGIETCETTADNPIFVWEFPTVDINTEVVCTLACEGSSTTIVFGGEIATSRDSFSNSMDSDNDGKVSNSKDDNSGDSTDSIKTDDKAVVTGSCPLTITLKADASGGTYCAAYDTSGYIASGSLTCSSCAVAGTATTFGSGLRNFLGGDW